MGFPGGLVCALLLLLLMGGVQAVVLPRTKILLLLFLTAFIWVAVILILLLAVRYKKRILFNLTEKFKCLLLQTSMHRLGSQPVLLTPLSHLHLHRDSHLHHGPSQHLHLQRRLLFCPGGMRSPGHLSPHLPFTPIHRFELHAGLFGRGCLFTHAHHDQEPFVMRHGLGLCPFNRIKS